MDRDRVTEKVLHNARISVSDRDMNGFRKRYSNINSDWELDIVIFGIYIRDRIMVKDILRSMDIFKIS